MVAATVEVLAVGVMVEVVLAVVVMAAVTVAASAAFAAATSVAVDVTSKAAVTEAMVMVAGAASLAVLAGREDGDDGMRFQLLVSSSDSSTATDGDDVSDTMLVVAVSVAAENVPLLSAGLVEALMVVEAAMGSGVEYRVVATLLPFLVTGLEIVVAEVLENGMAVGLRT